MAYQQVPRTASVTMRFEGVAAGDISGSEAEVEFYVKDEVSLWDATRLGDLADYFVDWFDDGKGGDPAGDTITDDGWVLSSVVARDLHVEGGIAVTRLPNITGQRSGTVVPPSVTVLIRYQGDAGGTPQRGWIHWPGGVEADLNGNTWSSAFLTEVQNSFDGLDENLSQPLSGGDGDWAQVRVSRNAGTPAELEAIQDLRQQLREAIAATRKAVATTNTLGAPVSPRPLIGSMRDRRRD